MEVSSIAMEEILPSPRRAGRPKTFKSNGRQQIGVIDFVSRAIAAGKLDRVGVKSGATRGGASRKRSPLFGVKHAASPLGPLAPAVVSVSQTKRKPMSVSDIFDGLNANGFQFTSSEPKKNLAARIYRLKGVKKVSAGLFAAA